jgi:uncharacterized membrane protein (Fun14 family)
MYPIVSTIGGGFFVGILIGYALKKVVKIVAIVVGLFFAGIAYLQYLQIANINWNNLQQVSQNAALTVLNATFLDLLMLMAIQHISQCQTSGFP